MKLMLRRGDYVKYAGYWYKVNKTLNIFSSEIPTFCRIDHDFRKLKLGD